MATSLNEPTTLARYVGTALLANIAIGSLATIFLFEGIDVDLSADVAATAENTLVAEVRVRAKAYIAILTLCVEAVVLIGMF